MNAEHLEILSKGEEILERAQEVAHGIEERARKLMHDGGLSTRHAETARRPLAVLCKGVRLADTPSAH
jgi:hypothetical protein